jgi:hypothetical protein
MGALRQDQGELKYEHASSNQYTVCAHLPIPEKSDKT